MFPGLPDGTVSERLAHWLASHVFPQADAYIDLHGGDLNEDLTPFTLFPDGDAPSAALARAFGLPVAVRAARRGFTIDAAHDLGVPSVIAEVGGNGLRDEAEVARMTDGVLRVLQHLGMARNTIAPPPGAEPQIVTLWSFAAPLDGLWYPFAHLGQEVRPGEVLGEIRDLFGATLNPVVSEAEGTLLFRMTSLAVNKGEPLLGVGIPVTE